MVIQFNLTFAKLPPKEFVNKYVIGLKAVHIVAGFDFTYGYQGKGNMQTIKDDGEDRFQVTTIPKVIGEGQKISSTLIRQLLGEGNVQRAALCLGDFYETVGEILRYKEDGKRSIKAEVSTLPFYTLPAKGCYEIEARIENQIYRGISHIDSKTDGSVMVEIELFYPRRNIRKQMVKIKWLHHLPETKKIETRAKQYAVR